MTAFTDEEHETIVHPVTEMDAFTILVLTFHPVFSQSDELHFVGCTARNRSFEGDKNKDFLKGDSEKLTA